MNAKIIMSLAFVASVIRVEGGPLKVRFDGQGNCTNLLMMLEKAEDRILFKDVSVRHVGVHRQHALVLNGYQNAKDTALHQWVENMNFPRRNESVKGGTAAEIHGMKTLFRFDKGSERIVYVSVGHRPAEEIRDQAAVPDDFTIECEFVLGSWSDFLTGKDIRIELTEDGTRTFVQQRSESLERALVHIWNQLHHQTQYLVLRTGDFHLRYDQRVLNFEGNLNDLRLNENSEYLREVEIPY